MNDTGDFLRALYGADGGDVPGWLAVTQLPSRRVHFFRGDDLFGETPAKIMALGQRANVYIGICLLGERPKEGRGKVEDVLAVPGSWFDLDIAGPHHKTDRLPASRLEALDFLADVGLQPSLVVHSGGGLQAYWLYSELLFVENAARRDAANALSKDFQKTLIALGKRRGWKLDDTGDLARIFRPAGTLNHKSDPPKLVRLLWQSDVRYTVADIEQFVAAHRPAAAPSNTLRPAPQIGPTMRELVARAKAMGASNDSITQRLDRRIREEIAKYGARDEGSRDNTAIRIAFWLVDFGLSDAVALEYLSEWNNGNRPPLSDDEIAQKIANARRYGRGPVRRGSVA